MATQERNFITITERRTTGVTFTDELKKYIEEITTDPSSRELGESMTVPEDATKRFFDSVEIIATSERDDRIATLASARDLDKRVLIRDGKEILEIDRVFGDGGFKVVGSVDGLDNLLVSLLNNDIGYYYLVNQEGESKQVAKANGVQIVTNKNSGERTNVFAVDDGDSVGLVSLAEQKVREVDYRQVIGEDSVSFRVEFANPSLERIILYVRPLSNKHIKDYLINQDSKLLEEGDIRSVKVSSTGERYIADLVKLDKKGKRAERVLSVNGEKIFEGHEVINSWNYDEKMDLIALELSMPLSETKRVLIAAWNGEEYKTNATIVADSIDGIVIEGGVVKVNGAYDGIEGKHEKEFIVTLDPKAES